MQNFVDRGMRTRIAMPMMIEERIGKREVFYFLLLHFFNHFFLIIIRLTFILFIFTYFNNIIIVCRFKRMLHVILLLLE